ncbi:MAG: DUF3343 domain-containing protein [Thermoleophilia bacterium]|nr:DUF3343 domain-containing protein [Thermoleophilia bacterium]
MRLFQRRDRTGDKIVEATGEEALGLFLFDEVTDALAAERALQASGYQVTLVAPPPHLRAGCDLAVALPRVEQVGARRMLAEAGVHVRDWVDDAEESSSICDLVSTVDFGSWLMVRAGNMKMVVRKDTGEIVNTSGGGCPDIPYLNLHYVGRRLTDVRRPKDIAFTLCGLMLDRAYLEARALLDGETS